MISACDTQDFVPFGREYVRHHPGEFQIQVQNVSHLDTSAVPLVKSFRDFSLQETTGSKVGLVYTVEPPLDLEMTNVFKFNVSEYEPVLKHGQHQEVFYLCKLLDTKRIALY